MSPESPSTAPSPSSSKRSWRQRKLLGPKRLSSSVAHGSDSHPAVKLVVKLSSSSNKHPSIVSKTASALKQRYSSIISTRRGSAAATSKSDSGVKSSAMTLIAGQVRDCVVNVARCSSNDTALSDGRSVNCSDEVVTTTPDEAAADTGAPTSRSKECSGQTRPAEHNNTLRSPGNDMLLTNTVHKPHTTEGEGGKMNESISSTAVTDPRQQCQAVNDDNVSTAAECQAVNDDNVSTAAECQAVIDGDETAAAAADNDDDDHDDDDTVAQSEAECQAVDDDDDDERVAEDDGDDDRVVAESNAESQAAVDDDETVANDDKESVAQTEAECQAAAGDDVTVADGDEEAVAESEAAGQANAADEDMAVDSSVVAVDGGQCNVVTRDCCSLPAPFATSTADAVTVASDRLNTHSAKSNEEGSVGVVESCNLPSAANVAPSIISFDISTSSYVLGSVTGMSAVNQSSVKLITGSHKHDVNKGAELMSGVREGIVVKDENETLNCTVNEEVLGSVQSVCDNRYISGCNLDSAADNLMSVVLDMTVNRNPAVIEGSHRPIADPADDVKVAGILSTGTDMDHDGEGTPQKTTSTLCRVSQPCIAATNPLYSANTATVTSVTSSTSRLPFLEFLATQSILSADNTTASQLSISANSLPTVNSVNLTETASCVSAVHSSAVSSLSSCSVSQSGTTLPCQMPSLPSLVMLPNVQDSVVSGSSSSSGMTLLDLS